ncbi:MAG: hypothetical protein Q4E83_00835 [bacterium]|nr:hypothetical protein [bacterium]
MQNIPGNSSSIESMNRYTQMKRRRGDLDRKKRDLSMKGLEQNNKKENIPPANGTDIKDVKGILENTKRKLDCHTDEHKADDLKEYTENEKPRFGLEE